MNKNIAPKNSKGKHHGYQEHYSSNDKLLLRCMAKNDKEIGYTELHYHQWVRQIRYYIR